MMRDTSASLSDLEAADGRPASREALPALVGPGLLEPEGPQGWSGVRDPQVLVVHLGCHCLLGQAALTTTDLTGSGLLPHSLHFPLSCLHNLR